MEKIFSEKESEKLKTLDYIAKELEEKIEKQQDWHKKRKMYAVELVRKGVRLKSFNMAKMKNGNQIVSFEPLKLTFLPQDCGLEKELPEERIKGIKIYVEELISELNQISSIIKFKIIGNGGLEEFANIKLPCTFVIDWEVKF